MARVRERKFRLHFNRINMQRGLQTAWTIHRSDLCIPARNVVVYVELHTKFKPSGPQPRAYLAGTGIVIDCGNDEYAICSAQMAYALYVEGKHEHKETRFV